MGKVLITGSTGLLGSTLSGIMEKRGFEVIRHGFTEPAMVNADLSDADGCLSMLGSIGPDTIVNLVALANVDLCETNPNLAYRANIRPMENIALRARQHRRSRIIQISTDMVYGSGTGPHREQDIDPVNVYAMSKYCAEGVALQVDATILRTNFFGPSLSSRAKSFSDWVIEKAGKADPFRLFHDVLFSPLSMETLSEMIARVAAAPIRGVFNLGSRGGMSKRDFAHLLARCQGLNIEHAEDTSVEENGLLARRPKDMRMDSGLFATTFAVALPDLEDEIKRVGSKNT